MKASLTSLTRTAIGAATVGAMMIGAAPATARDRYDGPRHGYDYGRQGNSRAAVNQCVAAVERSGHRYGRANVTQVTNVDRKRDGYRIKGRVAVRDSYRDRDRWGRDGAYRNGKFTCDIRYGRVQNVKLSGLR
jgi:hypothetical protein